MKKNFKFILLSVLTGAFASCTMDTPFVENEQGIGSLRLYTNIKGETVTRADIDEAEMRVLRENAVVYIERKNTRDNRHDVVRKYMGLDNIPADIALAKGNTYLAEGWTGDSVSASFDAKFYRGKTEEFRVEDQTAIILKMNIANVLVSFAPETFELGLSDLTMTVGHSRGELTFSENVEAGSTLNNVGYFMMPSTDTSLSYTISGKTADGQEVTREGKIENVQRAHQYMVRLKSNENPDWGAGMIKIEIEDIPVIEEEVEIFGRPLIEGVEFDLADQVVGTPGNFQEHIVYVCGYNSLSTLTIGGENAPAVLKNVSNNNLTNNTQEEGKEIENLGIHVDHSRIPDASSDVMLDQYTLYFRKSFFDNLPSSDTEYVIEINAVDSNGKRTEASLRIANTESAIEVMAPAEPAPVPDKANQPMAVTGTQATLTGYLYDAEASDFGIMYREAGASEWNKISAKDASSARRKLRSMTRARIATRAEKVPFTVTITGLKPGTKYEYKTYADNYEKGAVMTFSTESVYQIPNASFEEWSTYKASTVLGDRDVAIPWSVGNKDASFWGSGNEGAATAGKTLTTKSGDMKKSGSYSARLASDEAVGVIAAGNLFVGSYVKTDGTNGILSLGRTYNGSHPKSLKVWANYRPASGVKVKDGNEEFVPANFKGGVDHGQIYVALTTEPVEIRTNPKNRKLFDVNDPVVLAYGEKTWTGNFGPDGALEVVEIPIEYNERAKKQAAKYLVVVVSASKYGDYFSGAKGSVFYLDDFELVY
ncbi:MAG: PCMD domain-containing protein [Muribaculaceae bacterium]|nr:PCMD domain-containing protein [Muribaculaceae bacterium]